MRTTLDLPENLIEEARALLGFKRELIRCKRIEELKALLGNVRLDIDVPASRRRSRRRSSGTGSTRGVLCCFREP